MNIVYNKFVKNIRCKVRKIFNYLFIIREYRMYKLLTKQGRLSSVVKKVR